MENFDGGAVPEVDSVAGKGGDPMKAAMAKMAKAFQAGLKFPDKALKVGDTFVQTMPMDMPMAGMQIKVNSTVTYKLVSIDNNKANFELIYVLSTDIDAKGMAMSMTGGGDGKMVYDIPESYPVEMVSNMNIAYKMVMPQSKGAKMDGKIKMAMGVETVISKN